MLLDIHQMEKNQEKETHLWVPNTKNNKINWTKASPATSQGKTHTATPTQKSKSKLKWTDWIPMADKTHKDMENWQSHQKKMTQISRWNLEWLLTTSSSLPTANSCWHLMNSTKSDIWMPWSHGATSIQMLHRSLCISLATTRRNGMTIPKSIFMKMTAKCT